MFRTQISNHLPRLLACLVVASSLVACSKPHADEPAPTNGTIALTDVKPGISATLLKDANFSFVLDPNPVSSKNGRTQYLSRELDSKGGRYMAQCTNGVCFLVQVLYEAKAIDKAQGLETLKAVMPADAPPLAKTDMHKSGKETVEIYEYGDRYGGALTYADKTATRVKMVSGSIFKPNELGTWFGIASPKSK
jgi:hypothetical protein